METITEKSLQERNKEVVRNFWDIAMKKDLSLFSSIVSPDYIEHQDFGQGPGYEGLMKRFQMVFTAFPDFNIVLNDVIAEDDKVVCYYTDSGTFLGPWLNFQPTGNNYTMQGIHIMRIKDEKLVEHWAVVDALSLYLTMGVMQEFLDGMK